MLQVEEGLLIHCQIQKNNEGIDGNDHNPFICEDVG